jgi:hypothetical protein
MLQNESVKRWLGGLEPAWTLLSYDSFTALHAPPSPKTGPIRLATDLTKDEIEQSTVTRNALILLRAASIGVVLKLTSTGNLSRAVVSEMSNLFWWPDFERSIAFEFNKVVNELDFLPLHFVRHLTQAATLLRKYKGHLKISSAGRRMIKEPNIQALQALLFHVAFWHLDLGVLGRVLHHGWLQRDTGIILWCLSVSANEWQPPTHLSRLCTIPINGVLDQEWDTASYAIEAQVLRPLQWFGLLEHREEKTGPAILTKKHFYRKTAMFDRFLSFDVQLESAGSLWH